MHFTELMTSKLVGDVKLVGPTINCEGTAEFATGEVRQNPHVQSFAMATDDIGMRLLVDNRKVFQCYQAFQNTIFYSELGASAVILDANYTLDSFMVCMQSLCRQQNGHSRLSVQAMRCACSGCKCTIAMHSVAVALLL